MSAAREGAHADATRPTVHLLDDDAGFRSSTAFLLESLEYEVHEHAEPGAAIPVLLERGARRPSCLLLDIRMPGMSGLEVHDALEAGGSDLPIVYMTGHGDVALAVAAMSKGAFTFLQKPLDAPALVAALDAALDPEIQCCRGTLADRESVARARAGMASLTDRELQIVRGMVADQSTKEMARSFHIAIKTVELYRSRAMKKLGARNAAHLMRLVASCGAHRS